MRPSTVLLFAMLTAGCGKQPANEGPAKIDEQAAAAPTEAPVADTPERRACLAIESTFRTLRTPLERSLKPPFFPTSKEGWSKLADKHEASAAKWRDQRSALGGSTVRFGDAFAEKLSTRAKIARGSKPPEPEAPLPKTATEEERRKAALREAARAALEEQMPGLKDAPTVDRAALEKNIAEINALQKEFVEACLPLIYADPSPLASEKP